MSVSSIDDISASDTIDALFRHTVGLRKENPHVIGTSLGDDFAAVERAAEYLKRAAQEIAAVASRNPYSRTNSEAVQFDLGVAELVDQYLTGGLLSILERRAEIDRRHAA